MKNNDSYFFCLDQIHHLYERWQKGNIFSNAAGVPIEKQRKKYKNEIKKWKKELSKYRQPAPELLKAARN